MTASPGVTRVLRLVAALLSAATPALAQRDLHDDAAALTAVTEAAAIDAARRLVDQILASPADVSPATTAPADRPLSSVPAVAAVEPQLRRFVHQNATRGERRVYRDQTVEVDRQIAGDAVRQFMAAQFQTNEEIYPATLPASFRATGVGPAEMWRTTPEPIATTFQLPPVPAGWADVSRVERTQAARLAADVAKAELRQAWLAAELPTGQTLGAHIGEPGVAAIDDYLATRGFDETTLDPLGVAVTVIRLQPGELETLLEPYLKPPALLSAATRDAIRERAGAAFARSTETNTPIRNAGIRNRFEVPAWAQKTMTASAAVPLREASVASPATDSALAATRATMDARLQLIDQFERLPGKRELSLAELLMASPDAQHDALLLLASAQEIGRETTPTGVRVTLRLPLERLARIVKSHDIPRPPNR